MKKNKKKKKKKQEEKKNQFQFDIARMKCTTTNVI